MIPLVGGDSAKSAPHPTFTAGPVQFFAIDTNLVKKAEAYGLQLAWLRGALRRSRAPWKVVYGHHPVYSNGDHGEPKGYISWMRGRLLPVLKEAKVDVYLAGHDHDLEVLGPDGGVAFFVSGGGGREKQALEGGLCQTWGESAYGFTVLEIGREEAAVRYVDVHGNVMYETSWKKGSPPPDCPRPPI